MRRHVLVAEHANGHHSLVLSWRWGRGRDRLHHRHEARRLLGSNQAPPWLTGTMWSMWVAATVHPGRRSRQRRWSRWKIISRRPRGH